MPDARKHKSVRRQLVSTISAFPQANPPSLLKNPIAEELKFLKFNYCNLFYIFISILVIFLLLVYIFINVP